MLHLISSLFLTLSIANAEPAYVPNQLIVQFNSPTVSAKVRDWTHSEIGATADLDRREKLVPGMDLVTIPETLSMEKALAFYNKRNEVKFVHPNFKGGSVTGWPSSLPMSESEALKIMEEDSDSEYPVNDPMFGDQWSLFNNGRDGTKRADLGALEAWEIATGSREVIVAVVDTGVDPRHVDIMTNLWVNEGEIPEDGIDNDGNGYIDDIHGYNMIDRFGFTNDTLGHGTHVSGSIGAVTDNGIGIAGVNWNIRIMALKTVPNNSNETDADVIESFMYAANHGARVINCSFGKYESGIAVQEAIDEVGRMGVVVVAAAGNDATNNDTRPHYPSNFESSNLISVAATTSFDKAPFWTNFGPTTVDLGAPGSTVLSTTPDNFYAFYSGTSMATPHVSGAAALILSIRPDLSPEEVKELLMSTVTPIDDLRGAVVSEGRLNLGAAMKAISLI